MVCGDPVSHKGLKLVRWRRNIAHALYIHLYPRNT